MHTRSNFLVNNAPSWITKFVLLGSCIAILAGIVIADPPGTLDSTFGTGGFRLTDVSSTADDEIFAMAVQSDNKIVVVGYSGKPQLFTIARYSSSGTLDGGFGTAGIMQTAFSNNPAFARAIAIQSDGKIVVAGNAGGNFAIARYQTNGQIDTSFGTQGDGKVTIAVGNTSSVQGLAIQTDGKIIAIGSTEQSFGDFAVVRLTSNGATDLTFDGDGIVTTDFFGDTDQATSVKLQADGKILVGGLMTDLEGYSNFAIARYNTDGLLDTTFSGGTTYTLTDCGIVSLNIQSGGKIIVTGSNGDVLVARYNTDGTIDGGFGSNGIVTTNILGAADQANSLTLDSSGGIYVAGSAVSSGNTDFFVVKYSNNGVPDTMFDNGDGIVTTSLGSNNDVAYSIAIQPNAGIVVAGSQGDFGAKQFGIARYIGLQPTAANVNVSGRITNGFGSGVARVTVALSGQQGTVYTTTSSFGYYTFQDVEIGHAYIITPNSTKHTFTPTSRSVNLVDELTDADFVAN